MYCVLFLEIVTFTCFPLRSNLTCLSVLSKVLLVDLDYFYILVSFFFMLRIKFTMPPKGKRKAPKENQTAKKAKVEKNKLAKYVI